MHLVKEMVRFNYSEVAETCDRVWGGGSKTYKMDDDYRSEEYPRRHFAEFLYKNGYYYFFNSFVVFYSFLFLFFFFDIRSTVRRRISVAPRHEHTLVAGQPFCPPSSEHGVKWRPSGSRKRGRRSGCFCTFVVIVFQRYRNIPHDSFNTSLCVVHIVVPTIWRFNAVKTGARINLWSKKLDLWLGSTLCRAESPFKRV